ncbi:uncharacterized protein LOC142598216 [Dermatophagoides farinae]|uniref:Uncharacterized protein n=1 Tax=Dermatophagoides farinae TaxID=6954 RepID=A0A922L0W0_DERFA|nr:hypothetical protein HUG17_0917 [Dermatophagoides farinae]KAH9497792.1 hypothetical protein DERF_013751 [Dermatophagoides farinae]
MYNRNVNHHHHHHQQRRRQLQQQQQRNHQLVICFTLFIIISTTMIQANEARIVRKEKMLRLCLWTPCKSITTTTKKCPSYLEQSAKRKCKLSDDEIGFYSKCCLYEGNLPAIKETPTNHID